ncbi:NifB/NifX family molybdenum-iron cluster-binding protein [Vibrio metoecus]|uniref:NifB/NifX family molybdenum-iron cluster-binding protein n=1 Tax=Vibrio metoecus TaxID=1481663 RepID=UPI001F375228|nr:NifB/NifX family molybdenum-iron cluster-binding protein [Vibrio metoecus]
MMYAIPSRQGQPFNHFAKAPSFALIDSSYQQPPIEFTITHNSTTSCGKKTKILEQFQRYQVEAVVVRQIGQSMLQALFNAGIRVYALPRGATFDNLVLEQLQPITELSYGKSSPNKAHVCAHRQGTKTALKLSKPNHSGFSIKRLWKGEK